MGRTLRLLDSTCVFPRSSAISLWQSGRLSSSNATATLSPRLACPIARRIRDSCFESKRAAKSQIDVRELTWGHSGFSVHAKHRIEAGDSENLEKTARHATRAPIRMTSIELTASGKVLVAKARIIRRAKPPLSESPWSSSIKWQTKSLIQECTRCAITESSPIGSASPTLNVHQLSWAAMMTLTA